MAKNTYELGLGLTEEHRALADSVRSFAERTVTPDHVRAAVESKSEDKFPPFWAALAGQDLLGLHVPEDKGGHGAGLLTLAVALEALGRTAAPGPFVPTALSAALVAAADSKVGIELLPGLLDGSRTAAVALGRPLEASAHDGGYRVTGVADAVLGGEHADTVLLPITVGDGVRWAVVD
ncbi:MAG: acyl-CoA dehydrogenase family protein, partial [Rhodococcus sp. (in: high G+C Gram-positive bacteria)]